MKSWLVKSKGILILHGLVRKTITPKICINIKTNSIPSLTKLDLFFSQLHKMIQLILTKQLRRLLTHLAPAKIPRLRLTGRTVTSWKTWLTLFKCRKKREKLWSYAFDPQCMDVLDVVWVIVCIESSHFSLSTHTREGPSWWKWWIFPT